MSGDTGDHGTSEHSNAAKGRGNALRVLLFSILVVAIAALWIDRRARSACSEAHETVAVMVEAESSPTQNQVREALGREPHKVFQLRDGRIVEQYLWPGTVHEYSIYTYIAPGVGDLDFVTAVTLNTVREDVDLDAAKELTDTDAPVDSSERIDPARNADEPSSSNVSTETDGAPSDGDADKNGGSETDEPGPSSESSP